MDFTAEALEQHRSYLYRFALIHLRDPELSADAVQETMLAAIAGRSDFAGRSSPRSWLTGILKHKIADILREAARLPIAESDLAQGDKAGDLESVFDAKGRWDDTMPGDWGAPETALEQKQFWEVFERCCRSIPPQTAQVFMLREVMGDSIEEICKNLGITATNCSVMLYRARVRLRQCLEAQWFNKE